MPSAGPVSEFILFVVLFWENAKVDFLNWNVAYINTEEKSTQQPWSTLPCLKIPTLTMYLQDTDITKYIKQRCGFCGVLWEQKIPTHKLVKSHVGNVVTSLITKCIVLTILLMVYTIIPNICIIRNYIQCNINYPNNFKVTFQWHQSRSN